MNAVSSTYFFESTYLSQQQILQTIENLFEILFSVLLCYNPIKILVTHLTKQEITTATIDIISDNINWCMCYPSTKHF